MLVICPHNIIKCYDEYAVKLTATNNEHVSASSEILTINLATSE